MAEKRFKLVDRNGIYQILDLHKKGRHILTGEENVELLNKLYEENEQLKKQRYDLYMDIARLVKENEQLKEELNNLKKDETRLYHYYTLAR